MGADDLDDQEMAIQGVLRTIPEPLLLHGWRQVRLGSDGMVEFQAYAESVAELLLALGSQK